MVLLRDLIINRLSEINEFKGNVGGGVTLEAAKKDRNRLPCCIVISQNDMAEESDQASEIGNLEQRINSTYGIYILVDGRRAIDGKEALTLVENLKEKVREKLIGWTPEDNYFATQFVDGRIYEFEISSDRNFDNIIIWGELYTFSKMFCNNIV
jgi:hypothetical protein